MQPLVGQYLSIQCWMLPMQHLPLSQTLSLGLSSSSLCSARAHLSRSHTFWKHFVQAGNWSPQAHFLSQSSRHQPTHLPRSPGI